MPNTNASDSLFGWDFQINAAIVLMLEDIENVQQVRVEGSTEDIEITMTDGGCIFSQAKAFADPSSTNNVKKKLSAGLGTLNQAAANPNARKLIYITNSYNPLADKKSIPAFYGHSRKAYVSLPDSGKKVVDGILDKGKYANINKSKLFIYTLPFENDMNDRYKVVIEKVKDFISSVKSAVSGIAQELLDIWQKQLFENATAHDTAVVLSKKDIMWPLIVIMCDENFRGNPFTDDMDDGDYHEIKNRFNSFISCKCQKFLFVTRVLSDYQGYSNTSKSRNERVLAFVDEKWEEYNDEFSADNVDSELIEMLAKIIIYQIIQQRHLINDVRKRVNLL